MMRTTASGVAGCESPDGSRGRVLAGMALSARGDGLAVRTCIRHLEALGAAMGHEPIRGEGCRVRLDGPRSGSPTLEAECRLSTLADGDDETIGEAGVQALCGLMEVNGRQHGRPRRLGIEVAAVTAGVLSVQGLLACLLAQLRGGTSRKVQTSLIEAALYSLTHYFAAATCGDDWIAPSQDGAPAPPFRSADGQWFELEALSPDAWNRFWRVLGPTGSEVAQSWMGVVFRYVTATSRVHPALCEATARHSLREISDAATSTGVSVCRLRSYSEVLEELRSGAGPGGLDLGAPWVLVPGVAAGAEAREASGAAPPDARLPLAGLRVVEVTRRIQGPVAGLVLAMLGAEVTRVEPPGGDPMRLMPPLAGDSSARFLALNRGKRVVEIDIKDPRGRSALLGLVKDADVFLHNWAPGRAQALALDYEDLAPIAPRLVYGSVSGWGADPPPGSPVGTDYLVQAHVGLGDGLNPPDQPPFPSLVTITDVLGGLVAAEGLLAALVLRERAGHGAHVDTSLYSAAMALQAHVLEACAAGQEDVREMGRPQWGPPDHPVPVADGLVMVPRLNEGLAQLAGVAPGDEPRAMWSALTRRLASSTVAESTRLLGAMGMPCVPVLADLASLPLDPRFAPLFERVSGCWLPGRPWRFSA